MAGLAAGESIVNPDKMLEDNGINVIISKVVNVDRGKKQITLSDRKKLKYDRLVLGMGSRPLTPDIEGVDLKGVFSMRSLKDTEKIREYIAETNPQKLIFIGAGFISMELAAFLMEQNRDKFDIKIIEFLGHPLPLMFDAELGDRVHEYMENKGIKIQTGEKVTRILNKDGTVSGVELSSEDNIAADLVFLNVGTVSNLELAKDMGLEMGRFGIKVNEYLETSDPDILAGGDCIENHHFVTKKPTPIRLRGPAVIQGRLIAKRLAGFDIPFPGVLGNSAVRLFDKYLASTGLTEEQAKKENCDTVCATVDSRSKHNMIEGKKPWSLKLVFDRKDGKLLGGQIISDDIASVKEIDAVNALILGGKTIRDLTTLMCAGNPDCSSEPSAEPITIAAEQALQKLGK